MSAIRGSHPFIFGNKFSLHARTKMKSDKAFQVQNSTSEFQHQNSNVAFKACRWHFYLSPQAGWRLSQFISPPEFQCRIQGVPLALLSKPTS
jgi:hypothetical protein